MSQAQDYFDICPGLRHEAGNVHYSLRRYFVDTFFEIETRQLKADGLVLDLGGNKLDKRGCFDVSRREFEVLYANISDAKSPDVVCDAENLPFKDGVFSGVICGELLEHVERPEAVLAEAFRVLKSDGRILITCPFLFRVHGDPYDFYRYTEFCWQKMLERAGFSEIHVQPQGRFYSVLFDALRDWLRERKGWKGLKKNRKLVRWLRRLALERDGGITSNILNSYTTGYGITAKKG